MPRIARAVVPGVAHHVTQRGNNRQDVFFSDADRALYLELLRVQAGRFGLRILAWCLMRNHIHLVVVPERADSLARALGRTHYLYTRHVNKVHRRSGHLWQNRFYSCLAGGEHFWATLRYVERNPVRAGLVRRAWQWPWSSAGAHTGGADASGLLDLKAWRSLARGRDWRGELAWKEEAAELARLRLGTRTGRPLADAPSIRKWETVLGRPLTARPVGRPRKRPRKDDNDE